MSYVNMIMYGAVIPNYNGRKRTKGKNGKAQVEIKVDDPRNRAKVKRIFEQFD